MKAIYAKLEAGQDPAVVINASKSQTHFVNLPLAAEAFPADVRSELESMSVGSMKAPYVNDQDNTYNVVKLISKVQAPDSVAYRALPVQAADATAMATRADSVLKALNGGAKFDDLAKNSVVAPIRRGSTPQWPIPLSSPREREIPPCAL